MEYINIDKSQVPYAFDIVLLGVTYTFDVKYNNVSDFFTIDLYKQGTIVEYGCKMVYGKPLFDTITKTENNHTSIITKTLDYPQITILPYDLSEKETRVTYDNLGTTVFLYVRTEADLNA